MSDRAQRPDFPALHHASFLSSAFETSPITMRSDGITLDTSKGLAQSGDDGLGVAQLGPSSTGIAERVGGDVVLPIPGIAERRRGCSVGQHFSGGQPRPRGGTPLMQQRVACSPATNRKVSLRLLSLSALGTEPLNQASQEAQRYAFRTPSEWLRRQAAGLSSSTIITGHGRSRTSGRLMPRLLRWPICDV